MTRDRDNQRGKESSARNEAKPSGPTQNPSSPTPAWLPVERGDETAWLIEETWSGYVHFIHKDFDAYEWRREADSLDSLPWQWLPTGTGLTLTRRRPSIPFHTKDANEAMRFATSADADEWLDGQPDWMTHSDQYQPREHMWPASQPLPPPPSLIGGNHD